MTLPGLQFKHAAGDGGPRSRTQVVIIHATDNTASAANEAGYATHRPDLTSAHFYVDDTTVVQALRLDHIAYGALWNGNQISVQLELCGRSNHISDATMRTAAPIVAEVCKRYGIPVRKITAAQVRAGVKGICGHAEITQAFPEDHGDHTDPGSSFPWSRFINYVNNGEDEMPVYTSLSLGQKMAAPFGKTTVVWWAKENTDPRHQHADGRYPGFIPAITSYVDLDVALRLHGARRGDEWQLVVQDHTWKNGKSTHVATEVLGEGTCTSGDHFIGCRRLRYATAGHHLYVALAVYRQTSPADAAAPSIVSGTWRIRQDR